MTSRFIYIFPVIWALGTFLQDQTLPGAIPLLLIALVYLLTSKPGPQKPKPPASKRPNLLRANAERIKRRTRHMEKLEHHNTPAEQQQRTAKHLALACGTCIAIALEFYTFFNISLLPFALILTLASVGAFKLAAYSVKR